MNNGDILKRILFIGILLSIVFISMNVESGYTISNMEMINSMSWSFYPSVPFYQYYMRKVEHPFKLPNLWYSDDIIFNEFQFYGNTLFIYYMELKEIEPINYEVNYYY